MNARFLYPLLAVLFFGSTGSAQIAQPAAARTDGEFLDNKPSQAPTSLPDQEYVIGKDDLLEVAVFEVPELSGVVRVSAAGVIVLPFVGPVSAINRSPQELAGSIEDVLRKSYLNNPHVTVFVREYASQPVSVIGAVRLPGIYQIKGEKSLLDVLAMAQGLDQGAGNVIQVIRGRSRIEARSDSAERSETLTVAIDDLFENGKTELNVPIFAGDKINVLKAGSIFVVGEVVRPNEFVLRAGKNVSVTQAIALANGFSKEAKRGASVIIRYHRDGTKEEIPVDMEQILRGKANDAMMMPNDILFVPPNKFKSGALKALDTTIGIVSGRLIYGFR